jgi:hypothetical protein
VEVQARQINALQEKVQQENQMLEQSQAQKEHLELKEVELKRETEARAQGLEDAQDQIAQLQQQLQEIHESYHLQIKTQESDHADQLERIQQEVLDMQDAQQRADTELEERAREIEGLQQRLALKQKELETKLVEQTKVKETNEAGVCVCCV